MILTGIRIEWPELLTWIAVCIGAGTHLLYVVHPTVQLSIDKSGDRSSPTKTNLKQLQLWNRLKPQTVTYARRSQYLNGEGEGAGPERAEVYSVTLFGPGPKMAADGVDEVEAMISALSITAPLATSSAATPLRETQTQKLRPLQGSAQPHPH